jgi:Flp pilus assembly pilin Flp
MRALSLLATGVRDQAGRLADNRKPRDRLHRFISHGERTQPEGVNSNMTKLNMIAMSLFARLQVLRSETGQAMVEYTLIVALLSIVAVVAIKAVGVDIGKAWTTVEKEF